MSVIHRFTDQLEYSEEASTEPFWQAVYQTAFPTMLNCMTGPGANESQRSGVDRVILLASGRLIRVDEKKRRKVRKDFALEYISVDRTGAPGWMEKELAIDYLAYAFMPIKRVYLLPWLLLKRAWEHYKDQWKAQYFTIEAQNEGYKTISVGVPIDVVLRAIRRALIIEPRQPIPTTNPNDAKEEKQTQQVEVVRKDSTLDRITETMPLWPDV